jgi:flagellar basal-body rod modification protein FlgD
MMKIAKMSPQEMMAAQLETDLINKKINHGKEGNKGELGKDAFMKLLITQLRYQDPTRPMEDREFIAQMAQFSTLEQMTNMNKEVAGLVKSTRSAEAFSFLGRQIESMNPATGRRVSGTVTSIQYDGDEQMLMVGNEAVRLGDVHSVRTAEPVAAAGGGSAQAIMNTLSSKMITDAFQKAAGTQTEPRDTVLSK